MSDQEPAASAPPVCVWDGDTSNDMGPVETRADGDQWHTDCWEWHQRRAAIKGTEQ